LIPGLIQLQEQANLCWLSGQQGLYVSLIVC